MAGQDNDYLFEGFSRSDKIWVKEETWVDLAWKKHIPALKELLARMPPRDQGDIDREREMIEKQGRLDDIIERLSWENMSIEEMEKRLLELKREVAEIDEVYLVGGGKDWPLARGGEGEGGVSDEGQVGGEGGGGEGDEGRGGEWVGGEWRWKGKGKGEGKGKGKGRGKGGKVSIEGMKKRMVELKRKIAEIDDVYLVGGGMAGLLYEGEREEQVVAEKSKRE